MQIHFSFNSVSSSKVTRAGGDLSSFLYTHTTIFQSIKVQIQMCAQLMNYPGVCSKFMEDLDQQHNILVALRDQTRRTLFFLRAASLHHFLYYIVVLLKPGKWLQANNFQDSIYPFFSDGYLRIFYSYPQKISII